METATHAPTEAVQDDIAQPAQSAGELVEARRTTAPVADTSLLAIIAHAASNPQVDIDKFERLLAMQEKLRMTEKREKFDEALARAKAKFGPILKRREVDFTSAKGRTHYKHEDLAEIARVVDGPLGEEGVSYRFRSTQEGRGGENDPRRLRVTCIVSRGGYWEETTLEGFEDNSGNKNSHQAVASAATYLQRSTLKLALGLAAGVDDDGKSAGEPAKPKPEVTEEEFAVLRKLITETKTAEDKFLETYAVARVEDLTGIQYGQAFTLLRQKAARASKTAA
jgi:ERF superfamily